MGEFHQIAGYDVVAKLGEGAHSSLYAVRDSKGQVMVLKRVLKEGASQQRYLDQALAEHAVAQEVNHPRVRKTIKVMKNRSVIRVNEVLVLLEMVDGVTLEKYKTRNQIDICRIFDQAAEGLAAMHDAGFVHADIKPNNIMVTEREGVKLIDFGQSCKIGAIKPRIQGTPDYIAPEQVKRQAITERTDVFNLGSTIYWVLTGEHTSTLVSKRKDDVSVKSDDGGRKKLASPIERNPEIAPALSSLVMDCIQRDPMQRPQNMQQVRDRLVIADAQIRRQTRTQAGAESGQAAG